MGVYFPPAIECTHTNDFHAARESTSDGRRSRGVRAQHTVSRQRRSQKLIPRSVLWPLAQISECQMNPACNQPDFLPPILLLLPRSSLPPASALLISPLSLCHADIWEHDLVELVLEVSVSQVSHRQRDMLLRQVGVLLGVLDSDIVVREISAFNEHR